MAHNKEIKGMNMMEIQGAIFDMDGTLVDSLGVWDILWNKFKQDFDVQIKEFPSAADDKAVRTMLLVDAMEMIHQKYSIGESGEQLYRIATQLVEEFYRNDVELKKGVKEYLEYLHKKGVPMCLATATGMELVTIVVEKFELHRYMKKIISCTEIGKGKEEPDLFYAALQCLGTKKEETCVFEDSVVALTTAADAGFLTVGIYDKYAFDQEKLKNKATHYVGKEETMMKLV